jgi:hypothetical protein
LAVAAHGNLKERYSVKRENKKLMKLSSFLQDTSEKTKHL